MVFPFLAVFLLVLWLWLVRWLLGPSPAKWVLVSLPYSHYVELARWSLSFSGNEFTELKVAVGPHAIVAMLYRSLFRGPPSTTSFPGSQKRDLTFVTSIMYHSGFRRLAGVPVGVTPDWHCLPDSWAIMDKCGLRVDPDVLRRYDTVLGPRVRQLAYFYILNFSYPLYRRVQSCGRIQIAIFDACEYLFGITKTMKDMMDMTEDEVDAGVTIIRAEFESAGQILSQHAFLGNGCGASEFGGADLAFCALAGWVILPPHFHAGEVSVPQLGELPKAYQKVVVELRATDAGKHILKCYTSHRLS